MIDITDAMIETFRNAAMCGCHPEDDLGTRLAAVLSMPEVREAFAMELNADVTEEPPVGAKLLDTENDAWIREANGWVMRGFDAPASWDYVRGFAPLRRVR